MAGRFHLLNRAAIFAFAFALALHRGFAADTLTWHTNVDRVSADIKSVPLPRVLEGVAKLTGWHIFLESNAIFNVSARFADLPSGQALRHLLGDLSFALVPQTNGANPHLYVFRSSQRNATVMIRPADLNSSSAKPIPNEVVVTLKAGAKLDNIDCAKGARVAGRIDALRTYRLQFDNEAAAAAARECLTKNSDVDSVDSNFAMDRPDAAQRLDANAASGFDLKPKDPNGDCPVIIGLIDTPANVASLGPSLEKFFLPSISLADGLSSSSAAGVNPHASGPGTAPELSHGTAMAETILRSVQATTSGNTSVKILPVDVYGNNASTSTFDVAQGIYRAVNAGANVINLSLGSNGDSTFLHNLIRSASEQGVIFFGAAGNEPVTTPTYPAAYPEVMAVTAGDRNGQIANYANRGSFVDIMTPGTSVVPYQGLSFAVSGTSTAAAYASGIAAGLADANRACPPEVLATMRNRLPVNLGSAAPANP